MTGFSRRQAIFAVVASLLPSALLAYTTWVGLADGARTFHGHMLVVRDYLWLWGAGQDLALGNIAAIFDPPRFANWLRAVFGGDLNDFVWSYPPSMLFLAWPAGHIPIVAGFMLFAAAQLAFLWSIGRLTRQPWRIWLAVLASPAAAENMLAGQNGALTSALLVGGLLTAGTRPVLAGALFGLLTIKPQLGILVPVCLLASRDWRAIASACCTAGALFCASGLAFGFETWALYWRNTRPYMTAILTLNWRGLYYQRLMITPFMALRSFGIGLEASFAVQIVFAAGAAAVVWWLWSRPGTDPALRMIVTVCATLVATPYGYTYDLVGVAAGVATLFCLTPRVSRAELLILCLAWIWPGIAPVAGDRELHWIGPVLLVAVAAIALRRVKLVDNILREPR